MHRVKFIESRGGLARTSELLANGEEPEWLRIARNYGALLHVRRGWWALPGTPAVLLEAWRAGGRLACVSALAFHGETLAVPERLHIEVAASSHGAKRAGFVVHWSSDQRDGDRRAVGIHTARMQANRCRAANGSL